DALLPPLSSSLHRRRLPQGTSTPLLPSSDAADGYSKSRANEWIFIRRINVTLSWRSTLSSATTPHGSTRADRRIARPSQDIAAISDAPDTIFRSSTASRPGIGKPLRGSSPQCAPVPLTSFYIPVLPNA
ncbi:hypothetical protein PMAYCL1PPCAC_28517, partial [Pristionchus mayeri]